MKNSKILSLLTAAALVVSSFSGLAMAPSVAHAGNPVNVTVKSTADDAGNKIAVKDGEDISTLEDDDTVSDLEALLAVTTAEGYKFKGLAKSDAPTTVLASDATLTTAEYQGVWDAPMTVTPSTLKLVEEGTGTITASESGVTYSSDTPGVATVSDGVVTAVAAGTATITVSKVGFISQTVEVTVSAKVGVDADNEPVSENYQIGLHRQNLDEYTGKIVDGEYVTVDPTADPTEETATTGAQLKGFITYDTSAHAAAAVNEWKDLADGGFELVGEITGEEAGAPHFIYAPTGAAAVTIENIAQGETDSKTVEFTFGVTGVEGASVEFAVVDEVLIRRRVVIGAAVAADISAQVGYVSDSLNEYYDFGWPAGRKDTKTFTIKPTAFLKTLFGATLTEDVLDVDVQYTLVGEYRGLSLARWDEGQNDTNGAGRMVTTKSLKAGVTVTGEPTFRANPAVNQPYILVNGTVKGDDGTVYTFTHNINLFRQLTAGGVGVRAFINGKAYTDDEDELWTVSYDTLSKGFAATNIAGAAPAPADFVTAYYELYDTTYVKFAGDYNGKRVKIGSKQNYDPTDPANIVYLELTDAGKNATTEVIVPMKVTMIYSDAAHVEGARNFTNAASSYMELVINGKTDFEVALVDENGTPFDSTIYWPIDDMAAATKAPKVAQVRALNGYNIGSNGETAWVTFTKGGSNPGSFDVEFANTVNNRANDIWTVVGYANNEYQTNTNVFRITTNGQSNQSATLKVVVMTAGGKRAVAEYNLSTKIAGLKVSTWKTLAVGETLDLTKDVTVTYDGKEVTDAIDWSVDALDSQIKYLNKKITVTQPGKSFIITATYRAGVNTTASASETIKTVAALSVKPSSLTIDQYEEVKIADMTISGGNGTYLWEILDGESVVTTTGKVLRGAKAGDAKVRIADTDGNYAVVSVTVKSSEKEPEAGDVVVENGVYALLNTDLKTVTVYAADPVNGEITIPATLGGYDVVAIANQAFKGTTAKIINVKAPLAAFGKGAFKGSKLKKLYFFQADKLTSAGKNSFKGDKTKIFSVGADFSADMTKTLKNMSGVKKVKNQAAAN